MAKLSGTVVCLDTAFKLKSRWLRTSLLVIAITGRYRQRKVRLSENEIEPSCVRSVQKCQDQQPWKAHKLDILISISCGQSIGYKWGTPSGRKESWLSKLCIRSRYLNTGRRFSLELDERGRKQTACQDWLHHLRLLVFGYWLRLQRT